MFDSIGAIDTSKKGSPVNTDESEFSIFMVALDGTQSELRVTANMQLAHIKRLYVSNGGTTLEPDVFALCHESYHPGVACASSELIALAFMKRLHITSNLRSLVSIPVSRTMSLNSVIVISTASSAVVEPPIDLE